MKSKVLKTIAILVIIVMVFELTPSIVLGVQKAYADEATKVTVEEATKITNGFPEPPLIDEGLRETATIIGENVSKRTLNEKHYILDNGAMLAAVYPSNVHYEKNGELVDIDNTLIQAENTNEYTNKDNDFKVNLAKQTINGNLIKIEKNGYKVSWSLAEKQPVKKITLQPQIIQNQTVQRETTNELANQGDISNQTNVKTEVIGKAEPVEKLETINISEAKISTEKINMNKAKINTNDEKMQLEKINSSVKYGAILNGVDLKYDIAGNSVKESIILRNKNQICTEFTFNLETNGLKARLEKDKTVILYNEKTNEDIFVIEAPYMFDNKLEYSDDIEVELLEKNGKYQLVIKPEEKWLTAEERAYPVTIDPTVSSSLEREKIKDTYVYDGDTNNNTRGNAHIIRIGNSKWLGPNGGNPVRGIIKFELPKLDAGDQVIYATLGIFNYPKTSEWTPPTRELQIDVHKMTANWDENTAHWSNTNTNYDKRIADYILYQYNSSTPNTCYQKVFDITAIAKDWYTTGNNYGVMLKEHTEQRGYTAQSDAYFVSSDTTTSKINPTPQSNIYYRNQTVVQNYLFYH